MAMAHSNCAERGSGDWRLGQEDAPEMVLPPSLLYLYMSRKGGTSSSKFVMNLRSFFGFIKHFFDNQNIFNKSNMFVRLLL